jgi:hypothetical protein
MVPVDAVGVAGLLGHQLGREAKPHAGTGIGDGLPADIVLQPLRGLGEAAALLWIEHAGLLGAPVLLERLDGSHHAIADLAIDGAVVVAGPRQIRLDRLTLRLRHGIGGIAGGLQCGPDRNRRHRLRLDARHARGLRLGGHPGSHDHQCCGQHRSHDKSRSLTSAQLSTSAWSAPTPRWFKQSWDS